MKRFAPELFPPPRGEKPPLITGYKPKTNILAANAYELEHLRSLALTDRGNPEVIALLERARERLKNTCFGNFCPTGECYEAGIAVLRFARAAFPDDTEWISALTSGLERHYNDKKRSPRIREYYELALK